MGAAGHGHSKSSTGLQTPSRGCAVLLLGKAARECNCEPSSVPRHPATPLTHPTHPSHPPLPSARALAPQPDPSRAAPGAESGQLSMNMSSLLPRASSPEPLGSVPAPGARLASTHGGAGRKVLPSLLCFMLGPGGGLFPAPPTSWTPPWDSPLSPAHGPHQCSLTASCYTTSKPPHNRDAASGWVQARGTEEGRGRTTSGSSTARPLPTTVQAAPAFWTFFHCRHGMKAGEWMCSPSAQPPTQPTPTHTYRDRTGTARAPPAFPTAEGTTPPLPPSPVKSFLHLYII